MERRLELQIMNYYENIGERYMMMPFCPREENTLHLMPQK